MQSNAVAAEKPNTTTQIFAIEYKHPKAILPPSSGCMYVVEITNKKDISQIMSNFMYDVGYDVASNVHNIHLHNDKSNNLQFKSKSVGNTRTICKYTDVFNRHTYNSHKYEFV